MFEEYKNKEVKLKKNGKVKIISIPKNQKQVPLSKQLAPTLKAFNTTPEETKINFLKLVGMVPALKTADPTSLMLAIAQVNTSKLSLDPKDGEIAIIPYKVGFKTIAQIQYQWKGLKRLLMRDISGINSFLTLPVKKGDIKTWNIENNNATFNSKLFSSNFATRIERKGVENIGYIGLLKLDKNIYNQNNFMVFMTNKEIKDWQKEYSKTIISFEQYSKKTLAKKLYREFRELFKDRIIFKNVASNETHKQVLEYDGSAVNKKDGKPIYIDNPKKVMTTDV